MEKSYTVDDLYDLSDGRLTEASDGKKFEWRKMIEEVRKLGRPLTNDETEKYRISEKEAKNRLEAVENAHLLKIAMSRENSNSMDFERFVAEQGYSMDELEEMAESVEIE